MEQNMKIEKLKIEITEGWRGKFEIVYFDGKRKFGESGFTAQLKTSEEQQAEEFISAIARFIRRSS